MSQSAAHGSSNNWRLSLPNEHLGGFSILRRRAAGGVPLVLALCFFFLFLLRQLASRPPPSWVEPSSPRSLSFSFSRSHYEGGGGRCELLAAANPRPWHLITSARLGSTAAHLEASRGPRSRIHSAPRYATQNEQEERPGTLTPLISRLAQFLPFGEELLLSAVSLLRSFSTSTPAADQLFIILSLRPTFSPRLSVSRSLYLLFIIIAIDTLHREHFSDLPLTFARDTYNLCVSSWPLAS